MADSRDNVIWANLIHLSFNMWCDWQNPELMKKSKHAVYQPYLRFDEKLYNRVIEKMAAAGMNMLVLDLGDAVKYESHPEIAVKNAWSVAKLKNEITKLRQMGIEPIPKLNFSTAHDAWLGQYAKRVSSDTYYRVAADLIKETAQIFDTPSLFHLGMDEEDERMQSTHRYAAVRQYELWWHDLHYLVDQATIAGSRPWIWADYFRTAVHKPWRKDADFVQMPKDVLQSNWYYNEKFDYQGEPSYHDLPKAYNKLEALGYDQIPCGSNYRYDTNFALTVDYCTKVINPKRLKGFLMAPWFIMLDEYADKQLAAVDQAAAVIKNYNAKKGAAK
jgi:hypothetical protein